MISVSTTPIGHESLIDPNYQLGLGQAGKEEFLELSLAALQGWPSSPKLDEARVIDAWRNLTRAVSPPTEIG